MNWLRDLLEKILSLVPRIHKLEPFQSAIRTTMLPFGLGFWVRDLDPGIWFYWPLIQTIWWVNTAPIVYDLKNQSCMSSDGHDLAISGAITVSIVSARKYILKVHDPQKSLTTMALGVLCEFFSQKTFEQCRNVREINKQLKGVLGRKSKTKDWGIHVNQVSITDIGRSRNIRLLGDGPSLLQQSIAEPLE